MPEKPFTPPTRKPVSEFPTPDHTVAFYTELVNRDDPAYYANQPVKRGQLYATMVGAKQGVIDTYPQLFFLRERKFQMNDQLVLWDWATDEQAHDTYNAEITYIANAVTYPAFTRTYTVRRELYEADPTRVIGSPLPGIISVEITSPGQNHTEAIGVILGTSVAIQFTVSPEGGLLNGIITNTGEELIQDGTPITIIGDGQDSSAIAHSQPVGCVLTAQKKEELPDADPLSHELVKVTCVYETLPSPWIETTEMDKDGMLVSSKTRRQISDFITDGDEIVPFGTSALWVQTWHKDVDNFVAEETVSSRPVPGNPIIDTKVAEDGMILTTTKTLIDTTTGINSETLLAGIWTKSNIQEVDDSTLVKVHDASNKVSWQISEARPIPGNLMETTRIDNDGVVIHVGTTLFESSLITDSETLLAGIWTKTTQDAVSELVGKKIVESRTIPGNPIPSSRVDPDSIPVSIITTYKDKTLVVTSETLILQVWTKTKEEHCTSDMGVSDLVVDEVVESRAIPGNPMVDIKVDKDGDPKAIVKTLKDTTTIVIGEVLSGGVTWIITEKEAVSDLVAYEVVTSRDIPGRGITSYKIDGDEEIVSTVEGLNATTSVTPSSTESGGFITDIEADAVTDLIVNQIVRQRKWLDKAFYSISIENLIPREFMAFIPTFVESHILAGTASMPTLGLGHFEHSQKQLTKNLYEDRLTSLGPISLPITHQNKELTELYGGGVLNVNVTLDVTGVQTIDQGYLVTSSTLTVLGNGMDLKESKQLDGTEWPTITGVSFDQDMQIEFPFEEQVVQTSYVVTTGAYILETLDPIDDWRSKRKKVTKTPVNTDSASAIVTIKYHPFRFPGLLTTALAGYYVRSSDSQLCKHEVRTWWVNSASTPAAISVDEITMDDIIISTLNNTTTLTYSGPVLHDDITTFGVLFWPATTPSYSDYIASWKGNQKIIAGNIDKTDIPNLWKIQTILVTMR